MLRGKGKQVTFLRKLFVPPLLPPARCILSLPASLSSGLARPTGHASKSTWRGHHRGKYTHTSPSARWSCDAIKLPAAVCHYARFLCWGIKFSHRTGGNSCNCSTECAAITLPSDFSIFFLFVLGTVAPATQFSRVCTSFGKSTYTRRLWTRASCWWRKSAGLQIFDEQCSPHKSANADKMNFARLGVAKYSEQRIPRRIQPFVYLQGLQLNLQYFWEAIKSAD